VSDAWDPEQYNRFARERELPFWDLVDLLDGSRSPRVVDLGCGDGRLTRELGRRLGVSSILGLDSSTSMLEGAGDYADEVTSFALGDLATWQDADVDVVFANASLQWVGDHEAVLGRWMASLAPGGQLAVQVPANGDHPSHLVAGELAAEFLNEPFDHVAVNVLAPEEYARILYRLGSSVKVSLRVYVHELASSEDLVEWMKGTALSRFRARLSSAHYEEFLATYRERLLGVVGESSPYLFTFKRILMYARRPA
jgi:trans-aconitate 2-methyltransferase